MKNFPKTRLGKWSVGLHAFFLLAIFISVSLVAVGLLSFDDRWWDIAVALLGPTTIVATILAVAAKRKRDDSLFVILSLVLGMLVLVFILTHSLFISD